MFQEKKLRRKQRRMEARKNKKITNGSIASTSTSTAAVVTTTSNGVKESKPNSKSLRRKEFKAKLKLKKQAKQQSKAASATSTVGEFTGVLAEPGTGTMRSRWKLNDQAQMHKTEVNIKKKSARKEREKKELLQEKREVDRTKQKQKSGNEVDNFSFMVDKYKKMLDSNDGPAAKKIKRTKWYAE